MYPYYEMWSYSECIITSILHLELWYGLKIVWVLFCLHWNINLQTYCYVVCFTNWLVVFIATMIYSWPEKVHSS